MATLIFDDLGGDHVEHDDTLVIVMEVPGSLDGNTPPTGVRIVAYPGDIEAQMVEVDFNIEEARILQFALAEAVAVVETGIDGAEFQAPVSDRAVAEWAEGLGRNALEGDA
jgi:hypothetical protein